MLTGHERNAGQLTALLAAYRQAHPDDPNLPAWDLEVTWLHKDYGAAWKLLAEHRDGLLARPPFRWKRDDYLVRCLVKLNKGAEAVREAEAVVKNGQGNPVLLVLAHAARGGAREAVAAVEQLPPGRARPEDFYRDPDLGPIVRSESFKAFREKFPEPKEQR
jgi:hypothetical protein